MRKRKENIEFALLIIILSIIVIAGVGMSLLKAFAFWRIFTF